MSWTVHEDVYATAAPNVEDILKQVVDDDDDEGGHVCTSSKYTKSSQVFSSASAGGGGGSSSDLVQQLSLPLPPPPPLPPSSLLLLQQQQQQQQQHATHAAVTPARYVHSAQSHRRRCTILPLSSASSSSLPESEPLRAWLPPQSGNGVTLAQAQHVPCMTRLHTPCRSSNGSGSDSYGNYYHGDGSTDAVCSSSRSSTHTSRLPYTELQQRQQQQRQQHSLYSTSSAYTLLSHASLSTLSSSSPHVYHDADDKAMYTGKRTLQRCAPAFAGECVNTCADASACAGFAAAAAAAAAGASGSDTRLLLGTTYDEEWLGMPPGCDGSTPYAHASPHHAADLAAAAVLVPIDSLRGKVYETAKDQHGCRYLQRWLDANSDVDAVRAVVHEIVPHIAELMTDQYANFLVQKLFDVMPDDVRYVVARAAAPQMVQIALTPHGTFSVQKMIETMTSVDEMQLVRDALAPDVITLVKDAHGNHVVQKILQRFAYIDKEFIYEAVAHDCAAVARDKQGCCVLQRCLEHASPPQREVLVQRILSCCLQLVQDPFGNYVLQYVLQANDSTINDTIAIAFLPHLVQLCMNKFSSNVMEKVLRGASPPIQEMYVDAMCNADVVACLVQDDYGNYVLQTALSLRFTPQTEALVAAIRPLMQLIKNAPYAKKLESKMDAVMRKSMGGIVANTGSGGVETASHRYAVAAGAADGLQRGRAVSMRAGRMGGGYVRYDRIHGEVYTPAWDGLS